MNRKAVPFKSHVKDDIVPTEAPTTTWSTVQVANGPVYDFPCVPVLKVNPNGEAVRSWASEYAKVEPSVSPTSQADGNEPIRNSILLARPNDDQII